MTMETTFIHTNKSPHRGNFFQGYCFIEADFIYSQEGADQYSQKTGHMISSGLDGCYVVGREISDGYKYDVDFAGYSILYYFHDGETWAVSNSFAQVVDYLRSQKITIKPNYTHIAATAGRGMAASQLFSLETAAHGVRVVPRTHSIIITPHKAALERRPDPKPETEDYVSELSNFLCLWVRRFETLITDPTVDFMSALTGGLDSRTNFALLHAARTRLGPESPLPNLYCGSTPQNQIDFEVATDVAAKFNLTVRKGRRPSANPLSAEESYEQFRNLALGTYYPLYMPANGPSPMDINITGGGGGVHRRIYELQIKHNDVKRFIRSYSRHFNRSEYRVEFIHDAHNFLKTVIQPGEDPLRVLLREGRVRYHTGRAARYGISISPLHSVAASQAQLQAGVDRNDEGQFLYDIMHSLVPELLDLRFDESEKSPTDSIRGRLTKALIPKDPQPGRVWGAKYTSPRQIDNSLKSRVSVYKKSFDAAINNAFVKNFWDVGVLDLAQERMDLLASGKGYGDAANGKAISSILTADLVKPI